MPANVSSTPVPDNHNESASPGTHGDGDTHNEVADAFAAQPPELRSGLLELRTLILEVAEEVGAAPVQEVLKWGQPSYLSARPRESTTIRLGSNTGDSRYFGIFFHCRSTVLRDFRGVFPTEFRYEGNRGILFQPGENLQPEKLRLCISHALRYRVRNT